MTRTLNEVFSQSNNAIDNTKISAASYASAFTTDSTREQVMRAHQSYKQLTLDLAAAQTAPGIDAYAQEQWGPTAPGFTTKTNQIITAANNVLNWIQTNFPTVRTTLNTAMDALSYSTGQQNALRSQMGTNLDYVLTHQIQSGQIISPILPASSLAPLVTLLNSLAQAATMP